MSKRNDISQQIRKYLNGELDAHAMHQLEKEALNDPFLAEALDGYEKAGTGQQSNIDELHGRLKARTNKKEARIIPWRIISIAASVLIFLTVGGLFIKNYQPDVEQKKLANIDKIKVAPPAAIKMEPLQKQATKIKAPNVAAIKPHRAIPVTAIVQNQKTTVIQNPVAAADMVSSPNSATKDTVKLAEVKVVGYATPKKTSITASVQSIPSGVVDKQAPAVSYGLEGKVAGIAVSKAKNKIITGIVKDESGAPIPGASINIKGTSIGTQTNSSGYFKLDSVPNKSTLSVGYIGYNKKDVPVNKRDSLVIAMQPNSQSLNEVVVIGYGTKQQAYKAARPAGGWDDYKKYLKDNAVSPDGKTGVVKLSFVVNTDNTLSDFKILKSVSAKTDSAAVELVQNGPDWSKSTDNKPQEVKLRIKFNSNK